MATEGRREGAVCPFEEETEDEEDDDDDHLHT